VKLSCLRALALVALLLLLGGSRATAEVVINEVFYHAPDDLDDLEYIELLNTGSEPVDLGGWRLAKGVQFEFPAGTTIAAGEFVVVAKTAALLKEFYQVDAIGEFQKSLSNNGDEIQLKDSTGKLVETMAYSDSKLWPASADGGSASLERICPTAPAGNASNWAPSVLSKDYDKLPSGTPGKANSVFAELPPPTIESVTWGPAQPKPDALLKVSVQAGDLKSAILHYRTVAPGKVGEEESTDLLPDGKGRYIALIPTGSESNRLLRFRIVATDTAGGVALVPAKYDFRPAFTVYVSDAVEAGKIPVLQFFHAEKAAFDAGEEYRNEQARQVAPPPGGFGFGPPGRRPEDRGPPGRRPDDRPEERRPEDRRPEDRGPGNRPAGERRPDEPRGEPRPGGPGRGPGPNERGAGGPPGPPGFFGFFGVPRSPLIPQGPSAVIYTDPQSGQSEVFDFVNIVRRKSGWKIKFHKDRPLLGMTTLNLLYEPGEETILNEALAYELYRLAGNVSYLSGYMRLVINGQPVGYHLYFEQPNSSFFRRNKIDDSGDLYKLIWMGNAEVSRRLPRDKQPSRRDIAGRYEKKTHRHADYQQLIALIEELERAKTDEGMWSVIEKNFEVDQVINYFAVNSLLAHWDGFFNNFFFYYDREGSGKWSLYPWDQDSTWSQRGGAPAELYAMPIYFGAQGAKPDGLVKTPLGERRPQGFFPSFGFGGPGGRMPWWRDGGDISRPLLANPEFYSRFQKRLAELTDTVFTEEVFGPKLDEMLVALEPEARLRASIRKADEEETVKRLKRTTAALQEHLVARRAFIQKELQRDEK
jgi:hypothetical protein